MTNRSNIYRRRRAARKPSPRSQGAKTWSSLLVLVLLAFGVVYALGTSETVQAPGDMPAALALEQVQLPDETPEIRKDYTGFTVSFNPAHHVPNYVAWELTGAEADGTEARTSKFRADPDVLGSPTLDDYRNSGYDRGHMAPAGDMKWSRQAMLDSHYLTNMCPQSHQLNGGRWSTLENKCREWARRDSALIIITGPVLTDELPLAIGRTGVSVPERFFKVILAPFVNPPRAIAFVMPNAPTSDGIESMSTSVDKVEEITGLDFFAALPDSIENIVERQANYRDWNRRKR